jgi:hypothetical protein
MLLLMNRLNFETGYMSDTTAKRRTWWATATNGWWRQSQYDASAAVAFVLAP